MKYLMFGPKNDEFLKLNDSEINYIEKHNLKADFKHWAKRTSWTAGEAAMLFAGISPKPMFIDFELVTKNPKHKSHMLVAATKSWQRFKKMQDDFDIFQRGTEDDSIRRLATPSYWLVTAFKYEIAVPLELWDEVRDFIERSESLEKEFEAKLEQLERQEKIFYKSPQSDLQLYLEEIAEKEPDITAGKLLKRFEANLPDCILKIDKNESEKARDWKVTYESQSGEVKEIDYYAFNSALNRAKKKVNSKS